ncbi:hypothetical protein CHCC20335_2311 [Bacillus paralicheniformis]|nr:hypothetical protein CHCC20335_2311 [Bacillus paralicheniformis]
MHVLRQKDSSYRMRSARFFKQKTEDSSVLRLSPFYWFC